MGGCLTCNSSNNENCVVNCDNIHESCAVGMRSAVEQALSNALIVGNILEFLSPQDIIRASLVNKDWCAYSRECLRQKSKIYPVCAQISHDNPCRALADFNNFLQTIIGRGEKNQDTIIFNGIHQSNADLDLKEHTDCLLNDWKRGKKRLPHKQLTAKIKETYGKVLEKIKFRFIRIFDGIPFSCPFVVFIKFIISARTEQILELDFGPHSCHESMKHYLLDEDNNPRLLPNLEVFGTCSTPSNERFLIRAPAIKTLKHFWLDFEEISCYTVPKQSDFDFPLNVITNVRNFMRLDELKILVKFVQAFRPNLQQLVLFLDSTTKQLDHTQICTKLQYRQTCFTLGQLTSSTLTHLQCPLPTFAFMASSGFFPGVQNELEFKNAFPSLKKLSIAGWFEVDLMDWFSWIDFPKNFPQLETVVLTLIPPENCSPVNGPYNDVPGCVSDIVSTLVLIQPYEEYAQPQEDDLAYFEPGVTPIPRVLRLFAHIRHLDLKDMKLKCDPTDEIFADIINELENLPFLEELTISPLYSSLLHLDHIFLQNEQLLEIKETLEKANIEHLFVYKSSLLLHQRLKKINIHIGESCRGKTHANSCYSEQLTSGNFIVSAHTARLICKYRTGFQIHFTTGGCGRSFRSNEKCTNYGWTSGLHFEHLEPYNISTTESGWKTVRVFEFLNHNIADETTDIGHFLSPGPTSAMQSNKRNCVELNNYDIQESRLVEEQSAIEQALSNALIVANIMEFLSPQDIIRASLVNRDWCVYSRECLRQKSKKYPICAQITQVNPCRALVDFNNFLQTITGRGDNNPDTIVFNGIHQFSRDPDIRKHTDCLMNDWKRGDEPLPQEELTAKIQETYGKVLEKIKFKFIHNFDEIPILCPFVMFIKFIISERTEEILELDFGARHSAFPRRGDWPYYFQDEDNEPRLLPNLEVFGYHMTCDKFPLRAPALKTIKYFWFDEKSCFSLPTRTDADFPKHAITNVRTNMRLDEIKNLVIFIRAFRPSLQLLALLFDSNTHQLDHTKVFQDFAYPHACFTLGQLTSSTLTHLQCPLSTFAFMASSGFFPAVQKAPEFKNAFPSLKKLNIAGWFEVDLIDWFSWMDFLKNFPHLKTVVLTLIPPDNCSPVNGPYNYVHSCVATTVSTLVLKQPFQTYAKEPKNSFAYFVPGVTPIPRVLRLFAHIRHLDLNRMKLKCDPTDRVFADVINELENLPFLEELTIRPVYSSRLHLDHIFVQNEQLLEIKQTLRKSNMEHLFVYKSSLLHHKRLKKINIHITSSCRGKDKAKSCYCDRLIPGNFIVSAHTARLISMYRPGFQIHLTIGGCRREYAECTNYGWSSGLPFEHLDPYDISTPQGHWNRVRVFEF